VYLDGKSVGVLRSLELPLSLRPHLVTIGDGEQVPRYAMTDYVRTYVDPARVKGVHLYGGSRVATLDGDEFRRIGDRLMFSFTQGDRGKPRLHWPSEPIHVSTTIDMVSAITVYVDKVPPAYSAERRCLVDDKGAPIEGVPYAPVEQGKGTRVYVDGALVATIKRKTLTNDIVLADGATHARFSLAQYLAKVGVDTARPRDVDFISGDDLFRRMSAADWSSEKADLGFTVPARSQGQAVVDIESHHNKVSAIEIFVKKAPPERNVTQLDDFVPADDAKGGGGGESSTEDGP
jgi:hypothetical protein